MDEFKFNVDYTDVKSITKEEIINKYTDIINNIYHSIDDKTAVGSDK
jgi:hypothetical protein